MKTYTNVVFAPVERDALRRAALSLRIAFPRMDEEMPKDHTARLDDHHARVVGNLIRDYTTGTFDNLTRAGAVLARLVRVLTAQSSMDYWIAEHGRNPQAPPLDAGAPMTVRQHYETLADIRAGQLRDALEASAIIQHALTLATPMREETVT